MADPQLVDPHTYPGRPWPLSSLTVTYTDQYLRRAFSLIEDSLVPDSIFFLGDLFDGGREWSTATTQSPEERYRKYGDAFWLKEYDRFSKIFFKQWNRNPARSGNEGRGRRLVASLPGNHDLGFGNGVQPAVRRRFQAYFGRGNRVDVVGNHTVVSVDTVSLSAMDEPDPETGNTGYGASQRSRESVWSPSAIFLDDLKEIKARLETEDLRAQRNLSEGYKFAAGVHNVQDNTIAERLIESQGLPTILLTHVPLYRKPKTPCGPLRERWPPSSGNPEEDERNAITIGRGYQYQNVLTPTISNKLVSKIGPDLVHIYSGDDHDYCEIVHKEFTGSPKEITVKSLSWAMGVRRPGFVMTTLWNPVDLNTGRALNAEKSSPTIQNHLCLLPDQLGIFIYYAKVLVFTLMVLLARAVAVTIVPSARLSSETTMLPYHRSTPSGSYIPSSTGGSSSALSSVGKLFLANRSPPREPNGHVILDDDESDGRNLSKSRGGHFDNGPCCSCLDPTSGVSRIIWEFRTGVRRVAMLAVPFYLLLVWTW